MKSSSESQFQKLYNVFKSRQKEIPEPTRAKMFFIVQQIYNQHFRSPLYYDENSPQAKELLLLDKRALSIVFNTLVRSLLLEKKSVERECKLKFNGFFESWKEAQALIELKKLVFNVQKSAYKYKLSQLTISNCRKSKKYFELYINNKLVAEVKFISTSIFEQFISQLQSNIDRQRNIKVNQSTSLDILNKYQQESTEERSSPILPLHQRLEYQESPLKDQNLQEPQPVLPVFNMEDILRRQKLQGYRIIEESEHIYVLQASDEPKVHISLILKTKSELEKVVNLYLQQLEWNSAILSEHITEVEKNVLEIFRVFKKDSLFEMERATLTHAAINCYRDTATITEATNKQGKKDNKLVCDVSSITKFYRCAGAVKIVLTCSFDGKGYCTPKDSCQMLRKWYRDIKYFQNCFTLSQLQKNNVRMLIGTENLVPQRNRKEVIAKSSRIMQQQLQNEMKLQKESDIISTNDTLDIAKQNEASIDTLFYKLKPVKPHTIPSQDYLKLVLNLRNEKYYLKQRFDQSIVTKYDNYVPQYCLSELLKRQEYKITEKKQLAFINQTVKEGQKDSLIFVIKQIGANIVSGKSVLNVSLPVDIFEPRSLLERSAASFGMVPDYLIPVADADPLTQIKNIVTLFSSIPTLQLIMLKPFNPILGQTFQAYIKGIPIYYQQISHHPPISSFYMTCPQFTLYGNLVAFADVSLNSAVGGNQGITYIKMRNGSQFQCYFPPCQISGLIFGERTFRAYGKGFILEKKSNLFGEISIEKAKKGLYQKGNQEVYPASIFGGIFKIKPNSMQQILKQQSLKKYSGLSAKDVEEKLAQIRGTWFEEIRINNEVMNKNIRVYPLEYPKIALPSDSNYRSDVLYHKINDIGQSQKEKQVLEVRQRSDRKLREKYFKLMKKKK